MGSFFAGDTEKTDSVRCAFGGAGAFHGTEMKNRDFFWREKRR